MFSDTFSNAFSKILVKCRALVCLGCSTRNTAAPKKLFLKKYYNNQKQTGFQNSTKNAPKGLLFKGCVGYIFASLFCKFKGEQL